MNPFLIIALIGLLLKIWAGYRLNRNWRFSADRIWLLLFLVTSYLQTVVEVIGYSQLSGSTADEVTLIMHTYYLLITATVIIFPFSVATILGKAIHPMFSILAAVVYAVFSYALLSTDLIVRGYEVTHYIATRDAGRFYWVFQSMAITSLLLCLVMLIQSCRKSRDEVIRIKSANLLIGFVPFCGALTGIIVAMRMGSSITAAGILPLLISIYIVILVENLRNDRLLDLRAYLPWTEKARLLRRLTRPLREAGADRETIRELAAAYRLELDNQNRRLRRSGAAAAEPGRDDSRPSGARATPR